MFFANCIQPSSIESFDLVAVCHLQRRKDCHVAGLEFMGDMRGQATKENTVPKAKL
jgi:hypothetical protein